MKSMIHLVVCMVVACRFTSRAKSTNESVVVVVTNSAAIPTLRADQHEAMQRKLDRQPANTHIILDGDAFMNRWETTGKGIWNRRYAGISADFGIEGDRVENLLWRLKHAQIDQVDPKVFVLMIGTKQQRT